jgi:DNA-binding NarL/FixJ family response regulator
MAVRRVFIVWSHPIFHESVRALLSHHPKIEVVGSTSEHATAQSEFDKLKPDIILIEKPEEDVDVMTSTMQILENSSWGPRLAYLSLDDNDLRVYHREERTVAEAEDLINLILSD